MERLTKEANDVLDGQHATGALPTSYLGTEHLLLGLAAGGNDPAAATLAELGVTPEKVRSETRAVIGYGADYPAADRPRTPRFKKTVELALREALDLRDRHVGTEHLLLGLTRLPNGVATTVLENLGVSPQQLRRTVLGRLERRRSRS